MSRPLPGRSNGSGSSRRTVLGLGLGLVTAVTAAGCSEDDAPTDLRPGRDRRTAGPGTSETDPAGVDDPDTALVALLVSDLSRAHARIRVNRRAHPPLAGRLRGLERLHAAHAAELGGLTGVPPGSVAAEERRGQVIPRLASAERRLQARLIDDAVAAESGALALLLAAMAAGVAQERLLL